MPPRLLVLLAALLTSTAACAAEDPSTATFRDCPRCPELVRIPAGSFVMGSTPEETSRAGVPDSRAPNEHPPVPVTVERPFAIGRYEVTIGDFRQFADDTGFVAQPGCFGLNGRVWAMDPAATWSAPGYPVTDDYPAACLTAGDYQQYLDWLSKKTGATYRLPTEAEWEYVARLGSEDPPRNFLPGDEDACGLVNAADRQFSRNFDGEWPAFECDDGFPITSPVGRLPANKLGMYDVLGNTAEITADCFVTGHAGRAADATARVAKPCSALVFKGGSWAAEPSFLRPAFRVAATPNVRGNGFGLRVVRELDD
ncbi:MAG: SUMF1/EgtB/PvdO family nonheme iron enzyme [Chromatiales bacterium]|nr:MAG: SUMF1/EgtB/PvdO family nonheme iron enzyme [Chromatiales bacterium]